LAHNVRVLSVAAEAYPLIKTGGLGDVVGALPPALAREGVTTRTLIPGYSAVIDALGTAETVHGFGDLYGGPVRLLSARVAGVDFFVIDAPHLYARPGNPYVGPDGKDWPDNALRFAALAQCAAAIARGTATDFLPDVVHAHDWQAGLAPAYLHYAGPPRPRTVMTVHNLAFQGLFPPELLAAIGLPPHAYAIDGVEYYGTIGYLKAGIALADRITTVSPTYAAEIQTPEFGMGLDGLLRHRAGALTAILNGIDDELWDPATDAWLTARFDAGHLVRRAPNKRSLQTRFGLDVERGRFVFGVVSRLTQQKGMDLLLDALPALTASGVQLALLGSGDRALEDGFAAAAGRASGRIAAVIGYDEPLAHLVQGGADALLIPSRFEPCGLTQLCALRYGAIPVVTRVGGLADTVVDADDVALATGAATGVQFAPPTRMMLELAIGRTLALWRDRALWRHMQSHAMATDVGWSRPAKRYAALFRELVGGAGGAATSGAVRATARINSPSDQA
jgi:starch synthase